MMQPTMIINHLTHRADHVHAGGVCAIMRAEAECLMQPKRGLQYLRRLIDPGQHWLGWRRGLPELP